MNCIHYECNPTFMSCHWITCGWCGVGVVTVSTSPSDSDSPYEDWFGTYVISDSKWTHINTFTATMLTGLWFSFPLGSEPFIVQENLISNLLTFLNVLLCASSLNNQLCEVIAHNSAVVTAFLVWTCISWVICAEDKPRVTTVISYMDVERR